VSELVSSIDLTTLASPVCDTCGLQITEPDAECPALDEGVCAP
jgi:hypothetical protein